MQLTKVIVAAAVLLTGQCVAITDTAPSNPIENVVTMLKNLAAKAEREGRDEALTYQRFEMWCDTTKASLQQSIAQETAFATQLDDEVQARSLQHANLQTEIENVDQEIARNTASEAEAQKERNEANALWVSTDAELAGTIEALAQAIDTLRQSESNMQGSTASLLVAKVAKMPRVMMLLNKEQTEKLHAAVSQEPTQAGKPLYDERTKQYSFKSDGVIDLLYDLKEQFENQRVEATTQETKAQNQFLLSKDALEQAIVSDGNTKTTKTTLDGEVQAQLAQSSSELTTTRSQLEADTQALSDVKSDCAVKASEWEDRQKMRALEIDSMNAGMKILQDLMGLKLIDTSSQKHAQGSFLQTEVVDPKQRAMNLLRQQAKAAHSEAFEKFAQNIENALGGPFSQVNAMMDKMVIQLMAEQKDEDEHKAWCDIELAKTNATKATKEENIRGIALKMEADKATATALQQDIADLNGILERITAQMKEATEIRDISKAQNQQAMKDAKVAQDAIGRAQAIIEEYYKSGGYQNALVEQKHVVSKAHASVFIHQAPETWTTTYGGAEGQPEGLINILKNCAAEYAKMAADTRATEQQDQHAYDEQMKALEVDKARRQKELQLKTEEQKRILEKVSSIQKQKTQAENELTAIEQYEKDLGPACTEGDSTYLERKAAREMEIEAVRQAQVMLANANRQPAASSAAPAPAGFLQAVPVRRTQ